MKYPSFSAIAATAGVIGIALLISRPATGAWPESAFEAKNVSDAMTALFGSADNTPSGKIKIDAPDISEAGASVTVTVETAMQASAIAIIVDKNPVPLAANFELSDSAKGFVGANIRICQTSDIIAVVRSGGKLFTARRNVKVASGDCAAAVGKPKAKKSIRAMARHQPQNGIVSVEATISHPMGTQHITEFTATHNGKRLMTAQLGAFVSAKPRLSFRFAGARKGDTVELAWADIQGRSDATLAKVK